MIGAAVLALVALSGWLASGALGPGAAPNGSRPSATSTTTPTTAETPPEQAAPPPTVAEPSTSSEEQTTPARIPSPPTTQAEAVRWLGQRVRAHRPRLEAVLDRWVPIVSSKRVGLADPADVLFPGRKYDKVMVAANFEHWQQRYPDAVLGWSSDYVSHRPGFWITIVPRPRHSAQEVISWCRRQRLSPNDCYASRVSHTRHRGDDTARTWG
jgi:hypothetical protein